MGTQTTETLIPGEANPDFGSIHGRNQTLRKPCSHGSAAEPGLTDPTKGAGQTRRSPRGNGYPTPLLGLYVTDRLRQLPAVPGYVFEHTRALTVLEGCRFLEDTGAEVPCTCERGIDVRYAHLDEVCHETVAWRYLVGANIGYDDRTVRPDTQLRPMPLANPNTLLEAERRFQPFHRRSYIRIDQNRSHGDWRCGTVAQHERGI